eukprot:Sdes_comp20215_c0_seq1m13572
MSEESVSKIERYFCHCGTLALLIDAKLESLPTRDTDQTKILDSQKLHFTIYYDEKITKRIALKRKTGLEKQTRLFCKNPRCGLPLFYFSPTVLAPDTLVYILNGALLPSSDLTFPKVPFHLEAPPMVNSETKIDVPKFSDYEKDRELYEEDMARNYRANAKIIESRINTLPKEPNTRKETSKKRPGTLIE